jgi:ABC-type uncharacterized transport system permease subunit
VKGLSLSSLSRNLSGVAVPLLAVLSGLLVGAVVIVLTDAGFIVACAAFTTAPWGIVTAAVQAVARAYGALFVGALGSPYAISESLVTSTPYILTGLAVAVGFRAGLFNIGGEGQFFMGALASVYVGYAFTGLPWIIHLPLAMTAGILGGALWGGVPGYLKARTGAHEVVNTIMMNYIAFRLSDWLINGPMKRPGWVPITPEVLTSAYLPRLFASPLRLHVGFFLALLVAYLCYVLLFRTTLGFEMRAVGYNPRAAQVAGMRVGRIYLVTMLLSGGLGGLAGATQVLGVDRWVGQGFSAGYGFDSIALALLGQSHPLGVTLAALLFGVMRSGATRMQSVAAVPVDIVTIVQAAVIVFVAAPMLVRRLYRLRAVAQETVVMTRGWS